MHKFRIVVRCIPKSVSRAEVLKYFQSFCETATFSFEKAEAKDGSSGRMGTVYLAHSKDVERLLQVKHFIAGSMLDCEASTFDAPMSSGGSNLKLRRIFLRNIKRPIDDQVLTNFFSKFGQIESAYIVKSNKNGLSRGFGYITFQEIGPAENLLKKGQIEIMSHSVKIYPFQKYAKVGKSEPSNPNSEEIAHSTIRQVVQQANMEPDELKIQSEAQKVALVPQPDILQNLIGETLAKKHDSPATRSEITEHARNLTKLADRNLEYRHTAENLMFNISPAGRLQQQEPILVQTFAGCVCWIRHTV